MFTLRLSVKKRGFRFCTNAGIQYVYSHSCALWSAFSGIIDEPQTVEHLKFWFHSTQIQIYTCIYCFIQQVFQFSLTYLSPAANNDSQTSLTTVFRGTATTLALKNFKASMFWFSSPQLSCFSSPVLFPAVSSSCFQQRRCDVHHLPSLKL